MKVSMKGVLNKTGKPFCFRGNHLMKSWVWVPADVDFVARFHKSSVFGQNRRVSRIVLRGNTTSKVSAINDVGNEKISNTKTLKV